MTGRYSCCCPLYADGQQAAGGTAQNLLPAAFEVEVSEFGEAFNGAYAIHRALSTVIGKMSRSAPISVAEVIQQLGAEASTIPERELVGAIAGAAKEAGLEIGIDETSIAA